MPIFSYKAVNRSGAEITGKMESSDRIRLLNRLAGMGYYVSSVRERNKSRFSGILAKTGYSSYRIKRKSRIIFTRQMASLLEAGIPINTAFLLIARQTGDRGIVDLAAGLRKNIEGGSSISEALGKRRNVFSESYISMIEAGEASGKLAEVFDRLATLEETENERRESVRAALTYPAILVVASILGILFLLVAVFPTFVKIFRSADVTLPWTTRTIIQLSEFTKSNLPWIVLSTATVFLVLKWFSGTGRGRYLWDRLKLSLPLLGDLVRKSVVSSFAHTYQALNSSGVPVSRTLEISSKSTGNAVMEKAVLRARRVISDGETIAGSFEEAGEFPPLFVHMISIGEESGDMDNMLRKLCEYYEKEITYAITRLTAAIEPVLIAVMGFIIAFMYLSLITPMMQMMKVAKGGGL